MSSSARCPHIENDAARFLFAILKQVDLRKVNWEVVANDPALKEPIINGHAARMRFSRFRETINNFTGSADAKTKKIEKIEKSETKRKNRVIDSKARITKPKSRMSSLKSELSVGCKKAEQSQHSNISQYSPISMPSPYMNDPKDDLSRHQFPTPGSDDMSRTLAVDPNITQDIGFLARTGFMFHGGFVPHSTAAYSPIMSPYSPALSTYSPALSTFDDTTFDDTTFDYSDLSNDSSNFGTAENSLHGYTDFTPDWSDSAQNQF